MKLLDQVRDAILKNIIVQHKVRREHGEIRVKGNCSWFYLFSLILTSAIVRLSVRLILRQAFD